MQSWGTVGALLSLLAGAVWFDVRTRRIPNALVAAGAIAGLLIALVTSGWAGFQLSLLGGFLGLALLLPCYALRVMGAGDVKLLASAGTFLGSAHIFGAWLATLLAGGLLALAAAIFSRRLRETGNNLRLILYLGATSLAGSRALSATEVNSTISGGSKLPYSLAIALGTVAYLTYAQWPSTLP